MENIINIINTIIDNDNELFILYENIKILYIIFSNDDMLIYKIIVIVLFILYCFTI